MIKTYRLKENTRLITSYTKDYNKSVTGKWLYSDKAQLRDFTKGFEIRQNSEYSMNYYGKNISFKYEEIENNSNWELIIDNQNINYFKCISLNATISESGIDKFTINKIYKAILNKSGSLIVNNDN